MVASPYATAVVGQDAAGEAADALGTPRTSCSGHDIDLTLENPFPTAPDPSPLSSDEIAHLQGSMLLVVALDGTDADEVTAVWMGLGQGLPGDQAPCIGDLRVSGGFVEFYRGDKTTSDGVAIPFDTGEVPDGRYTLVLRALGGPAAGPLGGSEILASTSMTVLVEATPGTLDPGFCPPSVPSC